MSGPGIFFRILGPLTAELGSAGRAGSAARPAELDAGPFKQRLLLALLLCRCNGVVLTEQVIDTLWWDGPPRTAHKNVHVYITHLRKLLAADGQPGRLRYRPPGYQLRLSSDELDALRFEELSRTGRLALRRGDARGAAAAMRQALGHWRGQALADLQASPVLREEAARLEGRRLAAFEDWFEAELLLGNHAEVLEQLEVVIRGHPLRERLRGIQLTALYRSGRQAEALAEYDNLRQLLATELGLGPSPALYRLYQDILSGNLATTGARPDAPLAVTAPRHDDEVVAHLGGHGDGADHPAIDGPIVRTAGGLPRAAGDFTGRRDALRDLLAFFTEPSHLRRFAAVVGPPGSGTTTLAVAAAHVLAPRFRDGVILLPLRGGDGAARTVPELSGDLLGRLGPFTVPAGGDPSIAVRSRLAGLQLLLVLDGAVDEGQVRPLLPGAGDCSVILTSCRNLGGLDGITRFPLGLFTDAEALELLGRVAGPERIRRARPAALRIVRACGLLPLAVRIAGARLASLGHLPLEHFAARLEDGGRLLDELSAGDLSARACFDRYLRGLDPAERLALMQVATAWGPPSRGRGEMERLLERLTEVHALTVTFSSADGALTAAACPPPFAMPVPLWVYAQQLVGALVHADARS